MTWIFFTPTIGFGLQYTAATTAAATNELDYVRWLKGLCVQSA